MNDLVSKAAAGPLTIGGQSSAGRHLPPALEILFNDVLFERCKALAKYMAEAGAMVPEHLHGKPAACYAVISRAITWNLDPFAVAQCTYQTPGGRVGFEGKLVQAILENSGALIGPVRFEHVGPWEKLVGKFAKRTSQRGKEFMVPTWTAEDAQKLDLYVIVSAQIAGESEPREWPLWLSQCFPLNSTLWATDPRSQICYTAVRRFANLAAPGLFMGIPFDIDPPESRMVDITPQEQEQRPSRADYQMGRSIHAEEAREAAGEPEEEEGPEGQEESQDASSEPQAGAAAAKSGKQSGAEPAELSKPATARTSGPKSGSGKPAEEPEETEEEEEPGAAVSEGEMLAEGWREALETCPNLSRLAELDQEWREWKAEQEEEPDELLLRTVAGYFIEAQRRLGVGPKGGGKR